jgi:transcription antitermination factor NusA-like protein
MLESIGVETSEIDSQYIDVFVPAHNIKMVEQAENNIFILSLMTGEELEVEGNPFETATSYRIPS